MSEAEGSVRTVSRAIAVLRAFGTSGWLSLGEVASRTGLDKATTLRLLRALMAERLVEQDPASRDYALDIGVLELAAGATPYSDLRLRAQPVLAQIAQATGATTFLAIPHDGGALCIGRVDGDVAIQIRYWSVGGRIALNAGAGPRVLMAYLPEEQREALLASQLPQLTERTPTEPTALRAMLETVRARGWELGVDDVVEGVASLAVALYDHNHRCIAAISISGLHSRILENGQPAHLDILHAQARALEERLPR
ncbi:IclR family transcriptional regulator [Acidisoma silvae]|uniref:IclR family transcriptional regulator n=1 Tax=Acidisoma silvae TaxID=2802396 RepID=A0A963YXD2_9PROT|nr:IclR family transcriptional regulator [Acidisoma silvae]MCB8878060.1 IclR family transcriptional regulator [Acidisoma silvae]